MRSIFSRSKQGDQTTENGSFLMTAKLFLSFPSHTSSPGSAPRSLLQIDSYNTLEKSIHSSMGLSKAQIRLICGIFGFVLCVSVVGGRDREGHRAGAGVQCLLELPYEGCGLNPLVLKGFSSNQSNNIQCIDEKRALTVEMFSNEIMLFLGSVRRPSSELTLRNQ